MSHKQCFQFRAFTLIELLVVVAVISVLAAILLPMFASVRENGRRTTCLSNMKQIEIAMTAYAQDNEGVFPPDIKIGTDWAGAVLPYAPAKEVFRCPSIQVPPSFDIQILGVPADLAKGYAINNSLYDASINNVNVAISEAHVQFPASTVALGEFAYRSSSGPASSNFYYPIELTGPDDGSYALPPGDSFVGPPGGLRHNGGCNYVFVDGHVHWYTPAQVLNSNKPNDGTQPSFAL